MINDATTLFARFGHVMPKPHAWRLVDRAIGEINGLPTSHGELVASNGPLVAIIVVRGQSRNLFIGHTDWFIPDKPLPVVHPVRIHQQTKAPTEAKLKLQIADILAKL